MTTPIFIPATIFVGTNSGPVLIQYVDVLPLLAVENQVVTLEVAQGPFQPGMYVRFDQAWHYIMPIEAVSAIIVDGDETRVYIKQTQTTNLPTSAIVYRNGQLLPGHDIEPSLLDAYGVRIASSVVSGVASVNGMGGAITIAAGTNVTVVSDGAGTLTINATGGTLTPATTTALGGVIVPTTSNITVDGMGNIDLTPAILADIDGKLKTVTSAGSGTSLVKDATASNVDLKSVAAGTNITITDDGLGTLTIASSGGGAATITATGDVTGVSDAQGTLPLSLATIGVPGSYTKVTVDDKGRVVAGTNPSTLAGLGITDALPLSGGSMTGTITMTAGSKVTGVPDPVNPLDVVNKQSLDAALADAANGVSWRESVVAATTANLAALSGLLTVDGVVLAANDRVLVKNQTDQTQNGIYDAAAGAWTRSSDMDTNAEIFRAAVLVVGGTANALTQWANTNTVAPVIGTDNITFGQLKGAANVYTGGAGITVTGLSIAIAPTGVAAGTYTQVTVNELGQVTAGTQKILTSGDVTTALGYTPYNGITNPNGYIGNTLAFAGDVTGSIVGNTMTLNLTPTGVTPGTYTSVTVDAKGRVTVGGQISQAQILAAIGFTPVNKAGDAMTGALNFATSASLTAAATTDLASVNTNDVTVTGGATINSFGNLPVGSHRWLTFQGGATLTHNAGSMILPSAANIVTVAGDTAEFVSVGANAWRCVAYQRADGKPLIGGSGSPYSTKQVFNGSTTETAMLVKNAEEAVNIVALAPSAVQQLLASSGSVTYFTANATANWTFNLRHSASNTLDSVMAVGEAITLVALVQQGAAPFYMNALQVDGVAVTPKWAGGVAPVAGFANSIDAYSLTVIKRGAALFTVLASQTQHG